MFYEATISYTNKDAKGNDKTFKAQYLLQDTLMFSEAENRLIEHFQYLKDLDVITLKRSKIYELVNDRQTEESKIYIATIVSHFINEESGEEKETKYEVVLYAANIEDAHKIVSDYLKQGLEDMELVSLKCTKIVDVLR